MFSSIENYFHMQFAFKNKLRADPLFDYRSKREDLLTRINNLSPNLSYEKKVEKYSYIWKEYSEQLLTDQFVSQEQLKKVLENSESQLGRTTEYKDTYDPTLLFPVSRKESRDRIGDIDYEFKGLDIWNAYEFSGLDESGRPFSNLLQIAYDCKSENIVESKSLKLYLNSFNQTDFNLTKSLERIKEDLKQLLGTEQVEARIKDVDIDMEFNENFQCIDNIESKNFEYKYNPQLLKSFETNETESVRLYSNLLKSNCRHTKQPDWGSVYIEYTPNEKTVDEESLLKYIVSFRGHNEFHEECCERIMFDLKNLLNPKDLRVECKYTRRGGIDINPIRVYSSTPKEYSFEDELDSFTRTVRQ